MTDYDNYSVVYNCTPSGSGKYEMFWLLARENKLDDSMFAKLKQDIGSALPEYDFDNATELTKHNKCKYTWN